MGEIKDGFDTAFRDYITSGVPSSGDHEPEKREIRAIGSIIEKVISALESGILRFPTVAAMNASPGTTDGQLAYVYDNNDDPGDPANTAYQWDQSGAAWVAAPWYFDAVAGVVQPLIDEAVTNVNEVASSVYGRLAAGQRIGRGSLIAGSGGTSAGTFTLIEPIRTSGKGALFQYYGRAAGTAYLQVVSRSGDTNTVVREEPITVALGAQSVEFPDLEFEAGQVIGIRTPAGLIGISSTSVGLPADQYWASTSQISSGNSYVDAAPAFAAFSFYVTLLSEVDVSDVALAVGTVDSGWRAVGLPAGVTPPPGSGVGASTYVLDYPATRRERLKQIRAEVTTAGYFILRRFTRSGADFTRVPGDSDVLAFLSSTGGIATTDVPDFVLEAGQYPAVARSSGGFAVATAAGNPTPYFSGPSDGSSFTATTYAGGLTLSLGLDFEPVSLLTEVAELEDGSSAALPHDTEALHLVWMLGESHVAGRATSFSSDIAVGRGYCYRRATVSIAPLIDPTGNDSTAVSGSGRGSWGPPIGQAMLDMSAGAVGAVIVNSGLGSAKIIDQWADGAPGWEAAKGDWDNAVAAIAAAKIPVAGVTIVIGIGSNDAAALTAKATFKTGLIDLIARARSYVNAGDTPVALVQTGPFADGSTAAEVLAAQEAQAEIVREETGVFMASSAPKFASEKGWFMDNVHFNQAGNIAIGGGIAAVALAAGSGRYPAGLE